MRIIIVGSTKLGSADAPLLLARAFERAGCRTVFLSTSENLPFLAELGARVNDAEEDPLRIRSFSRHVLRRCMQFHPDVLFVYGSNPWIPADTIIRIKRKVGCKVVLWEVNNRCFRKGQAESIDLYDHIFALDSCIASVLRISGARDVHHLCAAADPGEHFRLDHNESDARRFGADVSFFGSPYPERVTTLSKLRSYDLRIYGQRWADEAPDLAPFVFTDRVLDVTKLKIYTYSRISLNIQGEQMINGENFRIFEAAACKAVCFSTYKPDLVKCFEPDKEVVVFEDDDDLGRKLQEYLAQPERLDAMGQAAYERFRKEHTYEHRVRTILSCIGAEPPSGNIAK